MKEYQDTLGRLSIAQKGVMAALQAGEPPTTTHRQILSGLVKRRYIKVGLDHRGQTVTLTDRGRGYRA